MGEELTYNVSYASFDIGQVRIKLVDHITTGGADYYKAVAYINSYDGVPLVNLHTVYENQIDVSIFSTLFRSRTKTDRKWDFINYRFDYPQHRLHIERGEWESKNVQHVDSLRIDTLFQDGLSLFYFARAHARKAHAVNIPTVVNEKIGNTYINFTAERTHDDIDAVDYDIDMVHFEGEAGFVGVFGLTGGFEGWFSNDAACVPIVAKMKVLIGNVRIELMSWKRSGWAPPRYVKGAK